MVLSVMGKSFTRFAVLATMLWCANGMAASPPTGLNAPPKPTAMPGFELPTTDGSTLRSESLRGQVVVLRYWASW